MHASSTVALLDSFFGTWKKCGFFLFRRVGKERFSCDEREHHLELRLFFSSPSIIFHRILNTTYLDS